MSKKFNPLILMLSVLLIATLACSVGGKKSTSLGDTFQSETGGYSLQKVADYEFEEFWGMTVMKPSDADDEVGPFIMAYGGLMEDVKSVQEILDEMQEETVEGDAKYSKPKKTKVGGVEGLLVEYTGKEDGQTLKGKMFVAVPYPQQEFYLTALSPEFRWKELEKMFDSVLKTVSFFEAEEPDFNFDDLDWDDWDWEDEDEFKEEDIPATSTEIIRQWASWADASSEYSSSGWSAMQATGAPNVENCGDDSNAWAPLKQDTEEYLVLYYDVPVIPTELVIYQSYHPSQVVEIDFVDTEGESWILWVGEPEEVSSCPDEWKHTIDLDEAFYADTVVIWVDQSVLGLGWVEIDAVELVGYPAEDSTTALTPDEPDIPAPQSGDAPANYSGLMAGPVYQGWINVIVGQTLEEDLDRIMTIEGRESTETFKPREDHKQTYLYDMPWSGMTGYISVTTDGWVHRKNVTGSKHPDDYALATVNWDNYEALKEIYNRDQVIPYETMADLLQSPGFLREEILREDDGKIKSTYYWYNADGEVISGIFYDGLLTGMAGLSYFTP